MSDKSIVDGLVCIVLSDEEYTDKQFMRTWLNMMIKSGDHSQRLWITPSFAEIMLEHNKNNRPVRESMVRQFAADMKAGRFDTRTTVSIGFKKNGVLADGQKRLLAIISSKVALAIDVIFQIPNSAVHKIDRGQRRSNADSFYIFGVRNSKRVAAMLPIIYKHDSSKQLGNREINKATPASVERNVVLRSADLLHDYYKEKAEEQPFDLAVKYYNLAEKNKMGTASIWGSLFYMISDVQHSDYLPVQWFFDKAVSGLDIHDPKEPASILRNKILEIQKDPLLKMDADQLMTYIMQSWNEEKRREWADVKRAVKLEWKKGQTFPQIR